MKKAVSASILVIVAVIAVVLGFLFLKSNSLVVPFMQPTQMTVNQVPYTFVGDANGLVVYTGIAPTGSNSRTLTSLNVGETYPCLGIDVKVLEVHADRYVISVTPNDAKPDDSGTIIDMATEELKITSMQFSTGQITVNVRNTGTTSVTVNELWVNNVKQAFSTKTVVANSDESLTVAYDWNAGYNYQVKLVSSKGNSFLYTAVAPS